MWELEALFPLSALQHPFLPCSPCDKLVNNWSLRCQVRILEVPDVLIWGVTSQGFV